ncbi:PREDICTED: WAS/WASL-interacting protein family member 3-like [Papilio xuthus]|uniref:Mediator of RNA polymerase II transcription subunit 26 n=1 Tax=Papilio xuthus TaxID=66420 RepID=A0AAJ6ZL07_PAPXU|nr:PREDICTED: WAS/WASL-interacting protein family member 3-like [Papilio xuthus]
MSNNAHDLSNRLLNALDNNYNVVDMHAVNEIISILEKINITKELLETTRLGKHVNELRRKTTDQTLARRAKVLVKRWRDLVIPAVASPAHTGSNRSSAERQMRRLGGTPLTSPALSRNVVSPAVPSPRTQARPAWGGYESDSQDVILVDDEPPTVLPPPSIAPLAPLAPIATQKPLTPTPMTTPTPPIKRQPSPEPVHDDKKAKRDKKPKKRRGHSRAGSGTESGGVAEGGVGTEGGGAWTARNGSAHHERRRNGCRRDALDAYSALVNRMPPAGAKKVKTTKELLEQIQSRGTRPASRPVSPASPASPDVMLIEPDSYTKAASPLRNGSSEPAPLPALAAPPSPVAPRSPLDEELAAEREACTCEEEAQEACPAAPRRRTAPLHVLALHNALLPGVNGTRAPLHPHQFAVRKLADPERPELFTSVVPLYKYSDYADDYCVKNLSRVTLCKHIPVDEFAPPPPDIPPPPSPPPPRPYPVDEEVEAPEIKPEPECVKTEVMEYECPKVEPEMVSVPSLEPSERLKAPLLTVEDERQFGAEPVVKMEVEEEFVSEPQEHRTVERTKEELDGKGLYALCQRAMDAIPYSYAQAGSAPVLPLAAAEQGAMLEEVDSCPDEMGRPQRAPRFAEWHECARLGDLIALPYVVID